MNLVGIQESQGVILLFVAIIIGVIVIASIIKHGIKSLIFWLIAYLYISNAILG